MQTDFWEFYRYFVEFHALQHVVQKSISLQGALTALKGWIFYQWPLCEFGDLPNEAGTSPIDDYTYKFISCCLKLVARLRTKHRCVKGLVLREKHCPSHRTCIQWFIHYLVQHKTLEQHKVLCGLSAPGHEQRPLSRLVTGGRYCGAPTGYPFLFLSPLCLGSVFL